MTRRTRAQIEQELLEWMGEGAKATFDDRRFDALALGLFRVQFEACAPYARLCRSVGRTPENVAATEEIPAVPTGAFKEFPLRCFPETDTVKVFRTSGTSTDRRGELHLDRLDLYEASLLASLRRCFLTDLTGSRAPMRFLAPSATEAPDSSLSHMFETLRRAEGSEKSGFDLRNGGLDLDALGSAIEDAHESRTPIVIAGTSFAFVHFLDAVSGRDAEGKTPRSGWRLPSGSRVMETGGFKGRSRVVPADVLRADIARCFGLAESAVVNQYGMTELGSQFYDSTLLDPTGPRRKLAPPWARVRIVDPISGADVVDGEIGLIVIHDLANTGSIAAVQTADLGRILRGPSGFPDGFEVLGRQEGAEARGCSIATDIMLEASGDRLEASGDRPEASGETLDAPREARERGAAS